MIEIVRGNNPIKIFAETFEPEAYNQVKKLANYAPYENSVIRIMPDVHAGKGCTIGTTMTIKDADDIRNHHYCDDFNLYVSTYATDAGGYLWEGMHQGPAHIWGISVTSNDDATIQWFVRTWVKLGYLEGVIPVSL